MPQIQKGTTYTSSGSGSQVTHTNLNAHVDNASLLAGAIDDQTINSLSADTDTVIYTKGGILYKQTKADFTKLLTTQTIDAGANNDVLVNTYDGAIVTGKSYTSANGITNTVTSTAHGLIAGQLVLISAATDSKYNGVFRLTSVTTDAFVYTMDQIKGAGSFVSSNGILVTVTTGAAHGLTNGQTVAITTLVSGYSGTFVIAVTGTTTFTYSLVSAQTATSGTVTYLANAALQGFGTLSYTKLATAKVAGSEIITANAYIDGNTKLAGDLTVAGGVSFNATSAIKLPAGTTSERPANPLLGQIRYNTDSTFTEVYNGTTWAVVGAAPFNATGGNTVIAPDKIVTTATFTSTDGAKVVVASTAHSVYVGTTVAFLTTSTGYSGTWTVTEKTTDTFTFWMDVTRTPVTTATGCTYNKNFQYKTHIFTSSGTFIPTNIGSTGEVEVLVVGGGGGGHHFSVYQGGGNVGGGGGGVIYIKNYKINSLTPITVTVGIKGANGATGTNNSTNGGDSSFGTLIAYGGRKSIRDGSGDRGGASGGSNMGNISYAGCGFTNSESGGGGAGGAGVLESAFDSTKNIGGRGIQSSITGETLFYGAGGGSPYQLYDSAYGSFFGFGGVSARANSGGGGADETSSSFAADGIVVVRYPWTPT